MSVSQNFPTIDPSLRLNFQGARTLDPRITFERSSIGTYVDEDGLIKTAAADQARFDYDPATGESLGLLIEESRTNFVESSVAAQGGNLTPSYLTISSVSNITSPDGTTNGVIRYTTSGGSGAYRFPISWASGTANTTYTGSIWARAANTSASFNIDVIDRNATGFTVGEQWTRVSVSAVRDDVNYRFFDVYAGDNQDIYLWGPQIEEGSFPTSYIPTSGSTLTRSADIAQITGTNFSSFYNPSAGTYIADLKLTNTSVSGLPSPFRTNSLFLFFEQSGFYTKNTTSNVQVAQGPITTNKTKWAFYHNAENGYGMVINGGTPINASQTIGSSDTNISFGDIQGETAYHLYRMVYYPERLTNSQLQNLTK